MTVAFRAAGLNQSGSTSVTPGAPTMVNTDAVLIHVTTKPDTATINVPTGWTLIADVAGGGGTTGNGIGPTRQAWLFREKDAGWGAMPAVSVTSGNITIAKAYSFSRDAAASWSIAAATGTFGSAGTTSNGSSVLGSNPGLASGDVCIVGYSSMTVPTTSAHSVTATGATFGAAAGAFDVGSTTSNDVGMTTFRADVTAGTATAAPTTAATFSSSTRGTAALIRLREVVASPTTINGGQATETDTAQAGVAGHLVTNLETNPSFETAEQWIAAGGSDNPVRDNTKAAPGAGSWSVKCTRGAGTVAGIGQRSSFATLLPGAGTYRLTMRQWVDSGITGNAGIRVSGTGLAGGLPVTAYTPTRNGWDEATLTFDYDGSGTAFLQVVDEALTPGATIYIDDVTLTAGSAYRGTFNGDTTDTAQNIYSWTSTAHASTSTRLATVGPTTINGGQATSASTVLAGAIIAGALILGGQATETDTATAGTITRAEIIEGGQAGETDQAFGGTISATSVIAGGQATETDEAFAGSAANLTLVHGGQALEVDTAQPGDLVLGYATSDTHNRAGGLSLGGYAVATWEPPVADPPPALVFGEARNVAHALGPVTMNGTQPTYVAATVTKTRHRDRIIVGGIDVTYFRDVPTPLPSYQLVSPLLYGPATIRFPQVSAAFEEPGVGALWWLKPGKVVKVQRVDPDTGVVQSLDYKGVVVAFGAAGADLTVEVGGEASGRAAMQEKQLPLFRATTDIGQLAFYAIRKELGLPFSPRMGPNTGIKLARFGGTGMLDYLAQLCARAFTRSGNQWTIAPVDGVYKMARKDTTTIDATAYLDDARVVGDLRRDVAEEPNRIFATGVTPDGQRVRFGAYPGLKQAKAAPYPFHNDRHFGVGTTNEETDTGDGVTVMTARLQVTKYLATTDAPGGFDSDAAAAIRELQDDAGLAVTGNMNPATWRALFDLDATGYSLRGAMILPAAQKSYTKPWIRSGSGAVVARNDAYDPTRLKVDANKDMGSGFTIAQMREWSRTELARSEDNWVGTITFHTGALIAGDHTPGDPVTDADVFRARRLKPGMNLSLPLFQGGIVVHVSGVSVGEDGKVTATVDTAARDSMAVWEVIARNRESRRDPARQWVRDHRASGEIKDAIDGWDEVGGRLGDKVTIPANQWVVVPVVAGQVGTIQAIEYATNPNAETVVAVFGRAGGSLAKKLTRRIGNPLTVEGSKNWEDEGVRSDLDRNHYLLYVAGSNEEPCGYFPKHKTGGDTPNPLTGRWKDAAGFSYYTFAEPVLYVALFADRATTIPAGRIMWPQLEAGA